MSLIRTVAKDLGIPENQIDRWDAKQLAKLTMAPKQWRTQMKNDIKLREEEERRRADYERVQTILALEKERRELVRERVTQEIEYKKQVAKTARWCPRCQERLPTIEKKKTGTSNQ